MSYDSYLFPPPTRLAFLESHLCFSSWLCLTTLSNKNPSPTGFHLTYENKYFSFQNPRGLKHFIPFDVIVFIFFIFSGICTQTRVRFRSKPPSIAPLISRISLIIRRISLPVKSFSSPPLIFFCRPVWLMRNRGKRKRRNLGIFLQLKVEGGRCKIHSFLFISFIFLRFSSFQTVHFFFLFFLSGLSLSHINRTIRWAFPFVWCLC